jgi:hypothetical protein
MVTIDLTDKYFSTIYMRGGRQQWWRDVMEVEYIIVHHTAGFYGPALTAFSSRNEEEAQIERMAEDHFSRFGIGPGYHYVICPSGRRYAVGKAGTHRAHTKGRYDRIDDLSRPRWNRTAIGVVLFGDFETSIPNPKAIASLDEVVDEIRRWANKPNMDVLFHGQVPTVNRDGDPYSQGTNCPGRFLLSLLASMGMAADPAVTVVDRYAEGLERGKELGWAAASDEALSQVGMKVTEAIRATGVHMRSGKKRHQGG